jgi:hypothetical protein
MNKISISQAWSYATSFFSDQHGNHAILLIGIGIVGPLILNIVTGGAAAGAALTPDQLASGAALGAIGGLAIIAGLLGYVLQTGSYYASWRMGLAPGQESLGSAISYGMVASLPVLLVTIGFILVFGILFGIIFGASFLPMLMGGAAGADNFNPAMGLGILLAIPVFLFLMLWLAARLCCMAPVMAANRSYNPLTAIAESWRMTAASQWKLMGYFVLIGIIIVIISMIFAMIAGVSMLAGGAAGGELGTGSMVTFMVVGSLVSIPLAYLSVAIPAGIFRALGGGNNSDVFA